MSLSLKTLLLQAILIVAPLIFCFVILMHSVTADILVNAARTSYDYGRYTMNSFEAEMLQIKATSNVVAESRLVGTLLTSREVIEDEDAKQRVQMFIQNTIRGNRNVETATVYATREAAPETAEIFPVWPEAKEDIPTGWRISREEESLDVSWVQPVRSEGRTVGVLVIRLFPSALTGVADSIGRMSGSAAMILTPERDILYSTGTFPGMTGDSVSELDLSEGYRTFGSAFYINILHCSAMNLIFMAEGKPDAGTGLFTRSHISYLWLLAGLAVLFVLAAVLQYMSVTRRIRRLSQKINHQIRRIEDSPHLPVPEEMEVNSRDEIGQLSRDFSNLEHQLFLSAQEEKKLETLQQTAKFSALQAQIQPHFLYNTLESLRMMAYENNDDEVAEMLFTLGKLMRSSISGKKQETTLKNELDNAENYLILNKLRFETLDYEITCTMDASEIACPKFILQPIVENSIYHGVSKIRHQRKIRIRAWQEDSLVTVEVEDNGPGMDAQRLEEIREALAKGVPLEQVQGGIGLSNVHSRLRIFFGEDSGLEIQSTPGSGTICRIHIRQHDRKRG